MNQNELRKKLDKYKNSEELKPIVSMSPEEKKIKVRNAYIVCIFFAILAIFITNVFHLTGFFYYLIFGIAGLFGFGYFLIGKTPVVKPKKEKKRKKKKKMSDLDRELLEQLEKEKQEEE